MLRNTFIPKPFNYFEMFTQGAIISLRAAEALEIAFADHIINVEELRKIKEIEHEGDAHVHKSLRILEDAFITPIDQEDLMDILVSIEEVTDHIDYVAAHIYSLNISETDKYFDKFIVTMVSACQKMVELMQLIHDVKHLDTKAIYKKINEINDLEEVADRNYSESLRELFTLEKDPIIVIKKKEIYQRMEDVLDRVEDTADAVEKILVAKL
jgi:hypothetical protein